MNKAGIYRGPEDARIMIVGDAPGAEEENQRRPFVGSAGQQMERMMLQAGINPSDVFFTGICNDKPPKNEIVHFFDPKSGMPGEQIINGLMILRDQIEQVNPNVIIAVGNYALWALTRVTKWNSKKIDGKPAGYTGIGDWRGSIIPGKGVAAGRKVVATYHPTSVLAKWPNRVYVDLDLKKALRESNSPEIRPLNKRITINPQGQDRLWWKEHLLEDSSKLLTIDIEYIGTQLICVGLTTDKDEAVVIPTPHPSDERFIADIVLSGIGINAQNGMFDASVMAWHKGIDIFPYLKHDTMIAAHAAYLELPKDLGTLCSIYTDQPCYWTKIHWPSIRKGIQSIDEVFQYNGIDVWVTHDVMEQQLADELTDPAVKKVFDLEMSLIKPLWDISRRGVRVDQTKLQRLRKEAETVVAEKGELMELLANERPFNVQSPKQVPDLLFKRLGFKPVRATKTGYSTDDFVLSILQLQAETPMQKKAIELIRTIRKNRSLISKFCDVEFDTDGRVRSHYNPAGTNTGRLAAKKFYPTGNGLQGQNIPRDKRARSVYVPDPGCVFFYNDLERAESLVVAHITGDPLMLAHHAQGVDAHRLLARELFACSDEEITDERRYMGKQTRHAGNYMEGWMTFMRNVNKTANVTGISITAAEAKFFIQRYRDLHPYLLKWWADTDYKLQSQRRLFNLLGRPREFFDRLSNVLPAAVAYVPQSTVGDVLDVALLRIAHDEECRDLGVELLLQVHDAVGGQIPERNLEPAQRRLRELMTVELINPRTREPFSIPVELQVGPSWGECKKMELAV